MKFAQDIIKAVCDAHGIEVEMLANSNMQTRTVRDARKAAIMDLRAKHLSAKWIAHFMKLSLPAVNYHLYPGVKVAVRRADAQWNARKRETA